MRNSILIPFPKAGTLPAFVVGGTAGPQPDVLVIKDGRTFNLIKDSLEHCPVYVECESLTLSHITGDPK